MFKILSFRAVIELVAIALLLALACSANAQVNWTAGGPGNSWGTGGNWNNGAGPGTSDIVRFAVDGDATSPIVITNVLDATRTIGGLAYETPDSRFHTTSLNGFNLTVAGDLYSGYDVFGTAANFIKGGGTLTVGTAQVTGNLVVGRADIGIGSYTNTLDLSGVNSFNGNLNNLWIGTTTAGSVGGQLVLAATNTINASTIRVGYSTNNPNSVSSSLTLGTNNTIQANEFTVGGNLASGSVSAPAQSTFNLGTSVHRTDVKVGQTSTFTANSFTGSLNVSNSTFNAYLNNLTVGEKSLGGTGSITGSMIGGFSGGAVDIGGSGNSANFVVGHVTGGGVVTGSVDFLGQTSLTANLNNLYVGVSEVGTATGTLKLAGATNTIDANVIRVGYSTNDVNVGTNSLALGRNNSITSNEFTIGGNLSNGTVTIPNNGSLTLGTNAKPTALTIGQDNTKTDFVLGGSLNLTGATVNATLSNLIVGEKTFGGAGITTGILNGGSGGAIVIGTGGNTANVLIGHTNGSGTSSGMVDFTGQTALTASLNKLFIGTSETGVATGTLKLAATNTIDANAIRVGLSSGDVNVGTNLLALGNSNTITASEFTVGGNLANGTVTIPVAGSLNLGTTAKPAALTVGQTIVKTDFALTGNMNLTGATVNATLSNLIVGEKTFGGLGSTIGTLNGGNGGAIVIGTSGNTASVIVGHTNSTGSATGTVDFSHQTSFDASLNDLYIGTSETGTASGTMKLAATNHIDANSIRVGYSTNDANSFNNLLALGANNFIKTNEFTIGGQRSNGQVTITPGGTLNLGTSAAPTNLFVGRNNANSASGSVGNLDLTTSTFNAFLGTVVVGEKSGGGNGSATGTLSTGLHGTIKADSITLGVGTGNGTFNFNGGDLTSPLIAKGTGTAAFNWNSGTLHVDMFGTAGLPFNLVNNGTGTLAPGDDPGLTTVFGNYTQGSAATLQIELGGLLQGTTFDHVTVMGNAAVGGNLAVSLFGGFQPALGQSFEILSANAVSGAFSHLSLPSLSSNLYWSVAYAPTSVTLKVVPEPSSFALAGIGLATVAFYSCRRGKSGRAVRIAEQK